jgi:hypothetical protein
MNVLWIEDFGGSLDEQQHDDVLRSFFGDLIKFDDWDNDELNFVKRPLDLTRFCEEQKSIHSIWLCRNYFDYVEFKNNHSIANEIDIVITDIRLNNGKHVDLSISIPALYEKSENRGKFHENAGFYIFNDLIHLGFPAEKMCFMTGEKETSFKPFEKQCADIYMPEVNAFEKSESDFKKLRTWLKEQESNYVKLRRGVIEGCNHLKTLSENELRFNDFIKEDDKKIGLMDLFNYIGVLENLLPLQEPKRKEHFYKLFVRTLAHEWEAAEPKRLNGQNELLAFSWTMKMSRNWLSHSKLFENLNAQDVAYLFILNIRTMFKLPDTLLPYEKLLLDLFDPISSDELKAKIGTVFGDRKIPLVENYAQVLKATGNTWQAINFHDALNNLQKNKDKDKDNENSSEFFIKGLYQVFWFLTSNGGVYIPSNEDQIKKFSMLNYQFKYFDYHKDKEDYLFEMARHIYNRSFKND